MSSLHLRFAASGLDPIRQASFPTQVRARAARLPEDVVAEAASACCTGLVVHHGRLPSGGTATAGSATVFATGSVWDGPGAAVLASPDRILAAWQDRPDPLRPLWTGVFALARCDDAARTLTVVSDRFGALPVYWREQDGIVTVSTQLKVLVDPGTEHLDEEAFTEFMAMGYLLGPRTLVAGVHRLPAHHVLICSPAGARVAALPEPGTPRNRVADDDALDAFDAMVARNLERFAAHTPSWAIALSGGLDSRLVAGAALRTGLPLAGFTAGIPGSLEVEVAARMARHLGIPLHHHVIDGRLQPEWFGRSVWFGEGRCLPNHMHYISANLLDEVPPGPLLHGLIGEGIMGGYGEDLSLLEADPATRRAKCLASIQGAVKWPEDLRQAVFPDRLRDGVGTGVRRAAERLWDHLGFAGDYGDTPEFQFRVRAVGMTVPNLISQVLPWTDVVSPFLDRDVFEFCNTLRAQDVKDRQLQLRWAERHFPAVTAVPRLKDGILIPVRTGIPHAYDQALTRHWRFVKFKYYLCRASRGRVNLGHRGSFPFYGQWYRRWPHQRGYVDGIVLSDRCLDRGLWTRDGMRKLTASLRHGRNTWSHLGTVLLVELFIRQFIEGTDRPADPITPRGLGR
ncbi:MAG: asparagine synthase-related protein [Candidatus Krumholzibacteriia bacterium]